mmetsp:Transcript_20365/g.30619  ORF Transcript_20365/g.30619 Transcript_20365/m.30619 type:complete len:258 (-) Transcript_20365:117-890(-)|eukprot:CAMPEP_0178927088 /NCGR_PEP_ID=MMETSP0786-20121207/18959_1 /TAXON_ID=186022 /ORGANISM="Thalassionema frauenfeldii, Strain CCMP 1798" /LENGTH=257 /DNA_ID=CAMNT_0020602413 /DNA_START=70 /DNA_END=843 /DNA_ORIENTATION=-
MGVEKTPLSPGSGNPTNFDTTQTIPNMAGATAAGIFAQEQMDQVRLLASRGSISIRLGAILGGVALIVTSILGFINRFVTFHWVGAILGVYTFGLGCIMILLEGKEGSNQFALLGDFESSLYKYALFVKFVWGRGILYFVAGTLEMAQAGSNPIELLVGIFVMAVGIAFVILGRRSAAKLDELRRKRYSPATLQSEFYTASEGSPSINVTQFQTLLRNLDVEDLEPTEWEAAFFQVEKADRDTITFSEFQRWWDAGQ